VAPQVFVVERKWMDQPEQLKSSFGQRKVRAGTKRPLNYDFSK
jgi:hypothetical protein